MSSGIPIHADIQNNILSIKEKGDYLYKEFRETRLETSTFKIHDPIKRQNIKLFKDTGKKVIIIGNKKIKTLEVNRNILSKIVGYAAKYGKTINFESMLSYPLSPIPLSLAYADGTRRKCDKSSLTKIINSNNSNCNTITPGENSRLI